MLQMLQKLFLKAINSNSFEIFGVTSLGSNRPNKYLVLRSIDKNKKGFIKQKTVKILWSVYNMSSIPNLAKSLSVTETMPRRFR